MSSGPDTSQLLAHLAVSAGPDVRWVLTRLAVFAALGVGGGALAGRELGPDAGGWTQVGRVVHWPAHLLSLWIVQVQCKEEATKAKNTNTRVEN